MSAMTDKDAARQAITALADENPAGGFTADDVRDHMGAPNGTPLAGVFTAAMKAGIIVRADTTRPSRNPKSKSSPVAVWHGAPRHQRPTEPTRESDKMVDNSRLAAENAALRIEMESLRAEMESLRVDRARVARARLEVEQWCATRSRGGLVPAKSVDMLIEGLTRVLSGRPVKIAPRDIKVAL